MPIKKGDVLICVEPRDWLTEGKEYVALDDEYQSGAKTMVQVTNDESMARNYFARRFKVTESKCQMYRVPGVGYAWGDGCRFCPGATTVERAEAKSKQPMDVSYIGAYPVYERTLLVPSIGMYVLNREVAGLVWYVWYDGSKFGTCRTDHESAYADRDKPESEADHDWLEEIKAGRITKVDWWPNDPVPTPKPTYSECPAQYKTQPLPKSSEFSGAAAVDRRVLLL